MGRARSRTAGVGRVVRAAALGLLLALPAAAENRAVVVGIDDYVALGAGNALGGAVADAQRFAAFLRESGDFAPSQVTLLLDGAATSDAIATALVDELIGRTRPGERAVLYVAGLGESDADGARALVAHDAGALLGRLPEDMLSDLLDLIPDREVLVVIDAGFAAAPATRGAPVARGLGPGSSLAHPFGQGAAAREVWNAAGPGQVAWEEGGGGVLTRALLATADGPPEAQEQSVAEVMAAWCEAQPPCAALGLAPLRTTGPRPAAPEPPGDPDGFDALARLAAEALSGGADGLALSLEGPQPLRVGAEATLRVEAGRPGQLALFDLHERTGLTLLGEGLAVGPTGLALRFRAAEPAGRGLLIALLSDEPPSPDAPLAEAHRVIEGLARQLRAGASPWSAALLPYEVLP